MITARRLFFATALLAAPAWAGGNAVTGERLALQCVACHGARGIAPNPTFPHLAGQNASYLAIQLQDFRSGERFHPVMSPIAQALSDEDIDDLSVYFATVPLLSVQAAPRAAAARPEDED